MRPLAPSMQRDLAVRPADSGQDESTSGWMIAVAVVLLTVCAWPILVSGLDALGRTWHPAGDWSVLELRARDVGSVDTPNVGPYSRFGWNHPGPMLFWLLSVPYRALGQSSTAILFGAALTNIVSVFALGVLAWRRGRLPLVAALSVGIALLCTHLGPSFLRDPWNPSITVLPFAVFVLLAWSASEGDRYVLPLLAFVGSFLVQSHVGFAALVGVLWVLATAGYIRKVRAWRKDLLWTAGVLIVCWLPILVDQLVGAGNLGALFGYFRGSSVEGPAGWATAVGVLARELGGVAPWLGGSERGSAFGGGLVTESAAALVFPALCFVTAGLLAWVRRARSAVRFQLVVLVSVMVGFVSVARITGPVFGYLVRWLWVLALLWWLSIFWSLWSAVFAHRATSSKGWSFVRQWVVVGLAVLALVTAGRVSMRTASGVDRIGTPDGEWYVTLDVIVDDVIGGSPREGPIVVRATGSNNGSIADALRLQLDRAGIPVAVDPDQAHKYGEGRLVTERAPVAVMTVVTGSAGLTEFAAGYGTIVAAWDPLTIEERRYATQLEDRLADQLSLVGRNDLVTAMRGGGSLSGAIDLDGVEQDLLGAVEQYRRQGDPVTVYVDRAVASPS